MILRARQTPPPAHDDVVRTMLLEQRRSGTGLLEAATYFPRPSASFTVNGRSVTVLLPWNYRDDVTYDVIYALHSYGATPADIKGRFIVDRANNFDDGFVVIAPAAVLLDGATPHWNYWDLNAGDFAFLEALDAAVRGRFRIGRALWMGYSNGGFLAIQFSIWRPALVHALVVMNAASGVDDPTAATGIPVPLLLISGDSDGTVLPAGDAAAATLPGALAGHGGVNWGFGSNGGYTSTANTLAKFASRNGTSGTLGAPGTAFTLTTTSTNDSADEDYSGNVAGNALRRCRVALGSHGLSLAATTESTPARGINHLITWFRTFARAA